MPSSNILLFDANKANMMADEQYSTNTQRLNGVQSGIASSQLQNKTLYQVSLVAYAIAQIMNQNGLDANDTAAVSAFVANLSGTMLQKVADLASTQEAQAGVATGKWMSPALVKTAIDTLAAKAQNILSSETKTAYGLGSDAVPDEVFGALNATLTNNVEQRTLLNTYTYNGTDVIIPFSEFESGGNYFIDISVNNANNSSIFLTIAYDYSSGSTKILPGVNPVSDSSGIQSATLYGGNHDRLFFSIAERTGGDRWDIRALLIGTSGIYLWKTIYVKPENSGFRFYGGTSNATGTIISIFKKIEGEI